MRVIPVLDIQNGMVVRGIAGRRSEYRPVQSCLTTSTIPVDVARAFRNILGLTEIYIADLDAIAGAVPGLPTYQAIQALGCNTWIDAGARDLKGAIQLADAGVSRIIIGLETITGPSELAAIVTSLGAGRVVFSLDLRAGQPMGNVPEWGSADPLSIAAQVIGMGIQSMIVLDLTRVGVGTGIGTEPLCAALSRDHPGLHLIAGGGVASIQDLKSLEAAGVSGVLVASALHDGRIDRAALERLGSRM